MEDASTGKIITTSLKKGGIAVAFRLTPPIMFGLETFFTAMANRTHPGSLAALGLIHPTRHFLTHTPGSFFNLLSQNFTDKKKLGTINITPENPDGDFTDSTHTANLWFAAQLSGLIMSGIVTLPLLWSGDFFSLFGIDPVTCNIVQDTFRRFVIGYSTIQAFSVNRQFIYSKCGDEMIHQKYILALIGVAEAVTYGLFGYGFIAGGLRFTSRGLPGTGYAFSLSNTVALAGSMLFLFGSRNLRKYLLGRPNATLIKNYMREIFKDGFPVSLRFVMENLSLVSFAVIAGLISQNELSALQICNTLLLPITGLCFSFITGIKAEIMLNDPFLNKKVMTLIALPTSLALLLLPFYAGIPKPLSSLFLNGQTPENRLAIETTNEKALPLLASVEILNTAIHGQRAVLQKAKDLWYPAGTTFLFLCAAFIPAAYIFGEVLGYDVPGMSTAYLIGMFAVMLAMTARFGYVLKNPAKNAAHCLNPKRCWAMFFGNDESAPLVNNSPQNIQITAPFNYG